MILVHNHPSGDQSPSKQDIELTSELEHILNLVDMHLLDHIIVAKNNTFSIAKNNFIKQNIIY